MRRKAFWAGLFIVLGLVAVGGLLSLFGRPVHAGSITLSVTDVADVGSLTAEVVDSGHGAAAGPAAIPLFSPGDCTVTSTADSGAGSLRACMAQLGAGDVITFDTTIFLPGNPQTITLNSELPTIVTDSVTIDGSNAGVILDGSGTPGDTSGLVIDSASNVVIKGLQILNFSGNGVVLRNGANNNTIGGANGSPGEACSGDCNLISGNGIHGVYIYGSSTMSNTVSGNYIGTDISGTAAISNTYNGVMIWDGAQYNVIGGDTAGERNLLSGNSGEGVLIYSSAMSNTVSGNYIGTNASGTAAIGNDGGGIDIHQAGYNVIGGNNATPGGACTGECNLVSGNTGDNGISIFESGAHYNMVSGNYIGTNVNGTVALSNTGSGVLIRTDAQYNVIGGDTPEERNLISGNGRYGVDIYGSGTMSNTVSGNYIGTNLSGITAIHNTEGGVSISNGASHNVIGGDTPGERNLISGNGITFRYDHGVLIVDSDTTNNTVSGNYIGTDINGTATISNTGSGVFIHGAQYNVIGGTTDGERNLISGNGTNGVSITGGAMSNTVVGNYIGTDASGTAAVGNGSNGVWLSDAQHNVIGGDTPGERNIISGNGTGVSIGSDTMNNTVSGNYIGTNISGTAAISNTYSGVSLSNGASYNIVGGDTAGERNLISGNGDSGVTIRDIGTTNNTVSANYIGTDAAGTSEVGNNDDGVLLYAGAQHNTIGLSNTIAYNDRFGVLVVGSTTLNNTITQNSIYSNTEKGIELYNGGNLELFPPILNHVGTNTVEGQAPPNSTVEIFSDADDEGRYFHGSTVANASGNFTFSQASAFTGPRVTATATDGDGNTSEFSAAYEPLVDVQVVAILQPKSSGKQNQTVTPTVKIGNAGTTAETGISVAVQATGPALNGPYAPSAQTVDLPPLGYATLSFQSLTPDNTGTYHFTATVTLAGDQNPGNDVQAQNVAVASDVIDLWTRDNEGDVGDVPAYPFWQSPDIWVRNADDGGTEHQDPIAGQTNYVYMIVRNRGDAASEGSPDEAKVYWHEPSLGIKCGAWALIGSQAIPSVAPNTGTQLLKFSWTPTRTGHTCLHGEIVSDDDPVVNPCDIPWDNNLSQRNVDIIAGGAGLSGQDIGPQALGGMVIEVTNIKDAPKPVAIIVDVSDVPDANAVRLDLGSDLAARWASVDGLAKSSGIAWSGGSLITVTNASSGTIAGIPMDAGETQTVTLLVNAPSVMTTTVSVYEAIDAGPGVALIDAIVGGNTYVFHSMGIYLPIILKNS